MKQMVSIVFCLLITTSVFAQKKTIAQIKTELQQAQNPLAYVREVLKKKYKLDTVIIGRIGKFNNVADSLAYHGQLRKVYGPFDEGKFIVQLLGRAPNTFYRISQIFIDTSVFSQKFADSLANTIFQRIQKGSVSFEEMAQIYSMGGEGIAKGDLGWVAQGSLIPQIEAAIRKHKKGDIFKVWTLAGVHLIKITHSAKQDNGFALMMRVFL